VAQTPGWESDVAQTSTPMPPYSSINHMGLCGMVNVFVANYPNLPAGLSPNSARFFTPSHTELAPLDERGASNAVLNNTACVSPALELRCVGNVAQACQAVAGGMFFRTVQDCNATAAGGNSVQMCQRSTGQCCAPGGGNNCR
jgi:hypothetical protein